MVTLEPEDSRDSHIIYHNLITNSLKLVVTIAAGGRVMFYPKFTFSNYTSLLFSAAAAPALEKWDARPPAAPHNDVHFVIMAF